DVPADDLLDRLLLPCERLRDLAHAEAGDVELGRRGPAQVIEVQILLRHLGVDLGLVEGTAEAVGGPRSLAAAGQDRGRPLRDAREHVAQRAIQRDDRLTARGRDYGARRASRMPGPAWANLLAAVSSSRPR